MPPIQGRNSCHFPALVLVPRCYLQLGLFHSSLFALFIYIHGWDSLEYSLSLVESDMGGGKDVKRGRMTQESKKKKKKKNGFESIWLCLIGAFLSDRRRLRATAGNCTPNWRSHFQVAFFKNVVEIIFASHGLTLRLPAPKRLLTAIV